MHAHADTHTLQYQARVIMLSNVGVEKLELPISIDPHVALLADERQVSITISIAQHRNVYRAGRPSSHTWMVHLPARQDLTSVPTSTMPAAFAVGLS